MAKIVFIALEIISLFAVIVIAYSTNVEHNTKVLLISLFSIFSIVSQSEQQKIEWTNEDELDDMVQRYIDLKADEGR